MKWRWNIPAMNTANIKQRKNNWRRNKVWKK